jgi:hypothetical protein
MIWRSKLVGELQFASHKCQRFKFEVHDLSFTTLIVYRLCALCWLLKSSSTLHRTQGIARVRNYDLSTMIFYFYDFANWSLWSMVRIHWFALALFKHMFKVFQMLVFKVQRESQFATCSSWICNKTLGIFFIFHFVWFYDVKSTHFVNFDFFLYVYPNWLFVCTTYRWYLGGKSLMVKFNSS